MPIYETDKSSPVSCCGTLQYQIFVLEEFKTITGFCVQVDEIADVLLHAADRQSSVCIWYMYSPGLPTLVVHAYSSPMLNTPTDWTVGIG